MDSQDHQIHELQEEIERLKRQQEALLSELSSLKDQLLWLRRKVFGKMSEKKLPLDSAQLSLFDQAEMMSDKEKAQLAKDVQEAEAEITRTIKVKTAPSRRKLEMDNLPVVPEHIYPEGSTDAEGNLKPEYVEIGTEVSSRLERIPARIYIARIIRHKVMLKSESSLYPEERAIITPEMPLMPVSKCMAGASMLTDIVIGKFVYHLPFYRIIQQYRESGFEVSDSTIGGWYEATIDQLKVLYDLLRQKILSSEYVQIDESVIPVIDDEKHRTRKGYEWVVRDGITGDVMFYYDRGSRAARVALELLGNYRGCAQSDGYEVYEQFERLEGITMYGCWAHARRKFTDSLDENRAMATEAICYIRKLYAVESEADDLNLDTEGRMRLRQKKSYPVIGTFEKWMMDNYPKVLPSSRIGRAIAYTYTLLPRLSRYVNDGRVNIDNNLVENAVRPLALGRKNYLFCGNDASAYRAAIAYSLISTCKAAGVDPREWMEDVLKKLPYYKKDGKDLTCLLPRIWKTAHE